MGLNGGLLGIEWHLIVFFFFFKRGDKIGIYHFFWDKIPPPFFFPDSLA